MAYYGLEGAPDVLDFVRAVSDDERETLLVREQSDAVEIALLLPRRLVEQDGAPADEDSLLQAVEGVSHFVYLAERVRTSLPTTRLELELQAEVDKFVLFAFGGTERTAHARRSFRVRLFEHVRYLHEAGSEDGDRYRLANSLAARYVHRLESLPAPVARRAELCRFYRAGQTEKLRMAAA